ncbi:MAG: glutaredoxin related protein [Haloquadratum walsbyi J07HQW2]|uniref:Glutaredoxin related protein n=1 Tax=Haloquadratum walsbyi J07HQW2 TaxID=1238425 RepID=U1PJ22_9EURY|nr:MAG: glutaredoxin related protein [Haloquadratum walsbyi J07HQW2]
MIQSVVYQDSMLKLYRLPGCPYCVKVERTLEYLDLDYKSHTVLPFRFLRFEVKSLSGQSGVPVLVDPEHGIKSREWQRATTSSPILRTRTPDVLPDSY